MVNKRLTPLPLSPGRHWQNERAFGVHWPKPVATMLVMTAQT